MPLQRCQQKGKFGWRWGTHGKCFTGKNARQKAITHAARVRKGITIRDSFASIATYQELLLSYVLSTRKKLKKKKLPAWIFPLTSEKKYLRFIKSIMKRYVDITTKRIIPLIPLWKKEQTLLEDSIRIDNINDDIDSINNQFEELTNNIFVENKENVATELIFIATITADFNFKQWKNQQRAALGISFDLYEPWYDPAINTWVNRNVNLIKGLTDEYRKKINETVLDSFSRGETSQALQKKLSTINKNMSNARTELIARDQIGKLNGQLTRKRQTDIGIDSYDWFTVGDERVRKTHRPMDGLLGRWDDPSIYSADGGKTWESKINIGAVELHPQEDYQCRCFASPNFTKIIDNINSQSAE